MFEGTTTTKMNGTFSTHLSCYYVVQGEFRTNKQPLPKPHMKAVRQQRLHFDWWTGDWWTLI